MNTEARLQTAVQLLAEWTLETLTPEANRLDIIIQPDDVPAAVAALIDAKWGYLSAITGLDAGVEAGLIEALYHFCSGAAIVSLRVRMPPRRSARAEHLFHHSFDERVRARIDRNARNRR